MTGHNLRLCTFAVLFAVPLAAEAETLTWGQLELKAGAVKLNNLTGEALNVVDTSPRAYDISGRLGADWGAFGAALDLQYGAFENDSDLQHHHDWGRMAALHLTYDLSPAIALGGVYGAGNSQPVADPGARFDFYALEGAYGTGPWQFGLQLGRFDAVDSVGTNAFHDGRFARIGAIYSLAANSVIEAEIGLFDGRQDGPPDPIVNMDAMTWSVEYTRQIGERPLAWSAGLQGASFEKDGLEASSFDEARATVGLTMWFGDEDLASAKKRGIFSQPDFGRILDAGNEID